MASPGRFPGNPSLRGQLLSSDRQMAFVYFLSHVKEKSKGGSIAGQLNHPRAMHLVRMHSVSLLLNSVFLKFEVYGNLQALL